jgi:hypothetical protein
MEQEFTPESGQMNPFLHLSLHLAVAEQISIDQPPGIRAAYQARRARNTPSSSVSAKRSGAPSGTEPLDGVAYLDCLRRTAGT